MDEAIRDRPSKRRRADTRETGVMESDMQRLFSAALLDCIQQGRAPDRDEIAGLAAKVRREAFFNSAGDDVRLQAMHVAVVAMQGDVHAAAR